MSGHDIDDQRETRGEHYADGGLESMYTKWIVATSDKLWKV